MPSVDRKLTVRISDEDLALLKEAAWRQRMSLSEWIRMVTLAVAKKTVDPHK